MASWRLISGSGVANRISRGTLADHAREIAYLKIDVSHSTFTIVNKLLLKALTVSTDDAMDDANDMWRCRLPVGDCAKMKH